MTSNDSLYQLHQKTHIIWYVITNQILIFHINCSINPSTDDWYNFIQETMKIDISDINANLELNLKVKNDVIIRICIR